MKCLEFTDQFIFRRINTFEYKEKKVLIFINIFSPSVAEMMKEADVDNDGKLSYDGKWPNNKI